MNAFRGFVVLFFLFPINVTLAEERDCSCQTTNLHCVPEEDLATYCGGGAGACVKRRPSGSCVTYMKAEDCVSMQLVQDVDLENGSSFRDIPADQLTGYNCGELINPLRPVTGEDLSGIMACCLFKHEVVHLNDSNCDSGVGSICEEARADSVGNSCLAEAIELGCEGDGPDGCAALCLTLLTSRMVEATDRCYCDRGSSGSSAYPEICEVCRDECQDQNSSDSVPAACSQYLTWDPAEVGAGYEGVLPLDASEIGDTICEVQSDTPDVHGCHSYDFSTPTPTPTPAAVCSLSYGSGCNPGVPAPDCCANEMVCNEIGSTGFGVCSHGYITPTPTIMPPAPPAVTPTPTLMPTPTIVPMPTYTIPATPTPSPTSYEHYYYSYY